MKSVFQVTTHTGKPGLLLVWKNIDARSSKVQLEIKADGCTSDAVLLHDASLLPFWKLCKDQDFLSIFLLLAVPLTPRTMHG